MLKRSLTVVALMLTAFLSYAAFILPESATVSVRKADDGSWRSDVMRDGVDSAPTAAPVITLAGSATLELSVGGTYTEYGATCTDAEDGAITVGAPTFSPALNMAIAGTYSATYACIDSGGQSDFAYRTVYVGITAYAGFGSQSSSFAADNGFDFAETFDGLQDWNLSSSGRLGNQWDSTYPDRMPKLANGNASAWGYFSAWSETGATPHNWIGTTAGGRQVWRGTKSLSIDMSGSKGPSRMGLYFGPGYQHFRFFYMVYMPKNMFPTSCAGGSCSNNSEGTYTEGQSYVYWQSFKLNTFSIACESARCPVSETYGLQTVVPHIKHRSYAPIGTAIEIQSGGTSAQQFAINEPVNLDSYWGVWSGVEFEVENISGNQYRLNVWVYDQTGNSRHMGNNIIFPINESSAYGQTWDHFFFGGNNSNSYSWGPTMQSQYYVDDFIIDAGAKGRIGPRYFDAIAQEQ